MASQIPRRALMKVEKKNVSSMQNGATLQFHFNFE